MRLAPPPLRVAQGRIEEGCFLLWIFMLLFFAVIALLLLVIPAKAGVALQQPYGWSSIFEQSIDQLRC